MATDKYPEHKALKPFFDVVMKGLRGFVDGEHFYDVIAEDAQFDFLYRFPGWPEVIHGRGNLIAAYSGYGNNIVLEKGDGLAVHHDKEANVVTLEIWSSRQSRQDGRCVRQPIRVHRHHQKSKDCSLERLHGLSCCMAGAHWQMKVEGPLRCG